MTVGQAGSQMPLSGICLVALNRWTSVQESAQIDWMDLILAP